MSSLINTVRVSLCAVASAGLVACGGGSSSGIIPDGISAPDGIGVPDLAENPLSALEGTWIRSCSLIDPDDAESGYGIETTVVTGSIATSTLFAFSDNLCATALTPFEFLTVESLEFPPGSVTTSMGEASFIDSTIEEFTADGEPVTDLSEFGLLENTFNIFLITDDELVFSGDLDEAAGDSPETRPTTLDPDTFFIRL